LADGKTRADRRADLLAAARAVLAERGLEATTISEIVARAGVAQGTFYLYFPSKMGIIKALTHEMNEHILAAVRNATLNASSAAEVVEAGVSAAFEQIARYQDILHIIHSPVTSFPTLDDWEAQFGPYRILIDGLIRHWQEAGEVDATVNPEITARLIIGLINHAADDCYIYNAQSDPALYITEVIRFISRALGLAV
jgi:AcrR family transcriptional regulator